MSTVSTSACSTPVISPNRIQRSNNNDTLTNSRHSHDDINPQESENSRYFQSKLSDSFQSYHIYVRELEEKLIDLSEQQISWEQQVKALSEKIEQQSLLNTEQSIALENLTVKYDEELLTKNVLHRALDEKSKGLLQLEKLLQEKNTKLEEYFLTSTRNDSQLLELTIEVKELRTTAIRLSNDKEELSNRLEDERRNRKLLQRSNKEQATLVEELQTDLSRATTQLKTSKSNRDKLEVHQELLERTIRECKSENIRLTKELEDATTTKDSLHVAHEDGREATKQLTLQLDEEMRKSSRLNMVNDDLQFSIQRLNSTVDDSNNKLSSANATLELKVNELFEVQLELESERLNAETLNRQLNECKALVNTLTVESNRRQERIDELSSELIREKTLTSQLNTSLESMAMKYETKKAENEMLQGEHEKTQSRLKEEFVTLMSNHRNRDNDHVLLVAANDALVNANEKLLNTLTALQRELTELKRPQPSVPDNLEVTLEMKRAFMAAASEGDCHGLRQLLSQGVSINYEDYGSDNALIKAASQGHLAAAEVLVKNNINVNHKNSDGNTALMKAASNGHLDMVKYLIENHAVVNVASQYGDTPLIYSILFKHDDIARLLIDNNADVNAKTNGGLDALFWAKNKNMYEIMKLISSIRHRAK